MGTCHRGFKNIPVPYTNFSKMYTQLSTNFSKIYTRLYTNFPKMHTRSYTNCKNCGNRYRSLYQNHENRYRSLYQNREKRYPSRWHVPIPKLCIVPPPPRDFRLFRNLISRFKFVSRFFILSAEGFFSCINNFK